jgi:hypothetical protein
MKNSMENNKDSSVMGGVKKSRRGALARGAGTGAAIEGASCAGMDSAMSAVNTAGAKGAVSAAEPGGESAPDNGRGDACAGECGIAKLAGSEGCPGGEKANDPASPAQLLLWVLALGLTPECGWFKAVGRTNDEMKALACLHSVEVTELRLLQAIGAMVRDEQLAALLRARLADQLLAARSAKELYEAVRVYEKLPQLAGATGAKADAAGEDDTDVEAAIAEARKLLSELDSLPRPEELEKLAEEGRSIIDAYTPGDTTS